MRLVVVCLLGLLACDGGSVMQGYELERETDTRVEPRTDATGPIGTEGTSEQLDEQQDNGLDRGPDATPSEEGIDLR